MHWTLIMFLRLMLLATLLVLCLPATQDCRAQQGSTVKGQAGGLPPPPNSALEDKTSVPGETPAADLMIGGGDLLLVDIFGSPDFHQEEVRVSLNGDISLPLIGSVHVVGLSPEEAQKLIRETLLQGSFYNNPQVSVFVKEYGSAGVYVLGEVQKPGFYPLLNMRRLLEAISVAGGETQRAGRTLTVTNPNRPQREITIILSNEANKLAQVDIDIMPGDTVVVSKAPIVYVIGDVRLPSGVVMEHDGLTVLQAIAMAQGTNPTAALNNAKLIRKTAEGQQEIPLLLKKILAGQSPDPKLESDDIVFVPSSAGKKAANKGVETAIQLITGMAIWGRF
jgi:polysaccharide export outer membrane protein